MDVEVSIERDKDGRLHGYVIERAEDLEGNEVVYKGEDMLSKGFFKYIDIACSECTGKLHSMFKSSILDPLKISFIYPGRRF
jgi:hypothetical protein